jgi:hypothetical protein
LLSWISADVVGWLQREDANAANVPRTKTDGFMLFDYPSYGDASILEEFFAARPCQKQSEFPETAAMQYGKQHPYVRHEEET